MSRERTLLVHRGNGETFLYRMDMEDPKLRFKMSLAILRQIYEKVLSHDEGNYIYSNFVLMYQHYHISRDTIL